MISYPDSTFNLRQVLLSAQLLKSFSNLLYYLCYFIATALFVPFSFHLVISRCIPTVIGTTLSNFLSTNQQNITGSGRNITEKDVQNGNM